MRGSWIFEPLFGFGFGLLIDGGWGVKCFLLKQKVFLFDEKIPFSAPLLARIKGLGFRFEDLLIGITMNGFLLLYYY